MDGKKYKEILDAVASGSSDADEAARLSELLEAGPDAAFDELCSGIWASAPVDGEADAATKTELLRRISISEDIDRREKRRSRWLVAICSAAAACMLLTLFLGYGLYYRSSQEYDTLISAGRGQSSDVLLPDGSRVYLNSAGSISYASAFNRKHRRVQLSGEAYFEVARNEELPFVVEAAGMSVQALGTAFNVRAYPDDPCVEAVLVEGSVKVNGGASETILSPGQFARYDIAGDALVKGDAPDRNHLVPWRYGEMLLNDESLLSLSRTLSRMYDLEICFLDEEIKSYTYTGLIRNTSLENILGLVSNTSPVTCVVNGNSLELSVAKKR